MIGIDPLAASTDGDNRVVIGGVEVSAAPGNLDLLAAVTNDVAVLPVLRERGRRAVAPRGKCPTLARRRVTSSVSRTIEQEMYRLGWKYNKLTELCCIISEGAICNGFKLIARHV